MKKTIIKILAIVVAVCCVLPMIAACTTNTPTESSTKRPSRQTEKKTETESEPEESETPAPTNNRTESSICFVGDEESSPESVFFDSLDEAVAAYPEGAVIKFCVVEGLTIEEPFHFPENGNFVLDFNDCMVQVSFDSGVVLECRRGGLSNVQYTYYQHLEMLLEENTTRLGEYLKPEEDPVMDPYVPYLWVFGETDGMAEGRYAISDANAGVEDAEPDLRFEKTEDLSRWGIPYVAEVDGRYFYTLQEAMDAGKSRSGVVRCSIIGNCSADGEDNMFVLPYTSFDYRIPYHYFLVYGQFSEGVTYDDGAGGYCYYSSVNFLASRGQLDGYAWIWSDDEGYMPGKYRVTNRTDKDEEKFSGDLGLSYVFFAGQYTFTRINGEEGDLDYPTFVEEMEYYYNKTKGSN